MSKFVGRSMRAPMNKMGVIGGKALFFFQVQCHVERRAQEKTQLTTPNKTSNKKHHELNQLARVAHPPEADLRPEKGS